jgi:hypothetical protein
MELQERLDALIAEACAARTVVGPRCEDRDFEAALSAYVLLDHARHHHQEVPDFNMELLIEFAIKLRTRKLQ